MKRFFRVRDFQPDAEQDVSEEFLAHLELKVEDLVRQGLSEAEAREMVRQEMKTEGTCGAARHRSEAQTRARLRKKTIRTRLDALGQDLRFALRRMVRSPGFTAAALFSLAIGIGANTAVYSVVNALILRPLPYDNPEELVRVYTDYPGRSPWASSAYPDYLDMKKLDDTFAEVAAWYNILAPVTIGEEPRMSTVEAVSANYFPMLGVDPALGRTFLPDEDLEPGQDPVVILGYGLWNRAFGADPGVLGRSIRIGGQPYTVVGVAPESYGSGAMSSLSADVIVPVSMGAQIEGAQGENHYSSRRYRTFDVQARLRAGVTIEEARARMEIFAANLQEAYPESNQDRQFNLLPAGDVSFSPEIDQPLSMMAGFLMAVVGLVLLLACTNLASFLLAQGVRRRKEIAVRLAMGAPRRRLVRQLLSETVLLGLLGGLAGVLVASWALGLLDYLIPALPAAISLDLGLDWRVLSFSLALSLTSGVLFGLAPALQSTRPNITPTLKESAPSLGRGRTFNLRSILVGFQMAVSVILLVGGSLFVRSLLVAQDVDPGFTIQGVGTAWIDLPMSGVPREEWTQTQRALAERIAAEPGIQSVAWAGHLPLALGSSHQTFNVPGVEPPPGQDGHSLFYTQVGPDFFETLGIPIMAGRGITPEDEAGAPDVVVVNQALAERFWPGESPIGKQILRGSAERAATVVGVVGTTKVERLGEDPAPFVYLAASQYPTSFFRLVARGPAHASSVVATLQRVTRDVNPNFAVMEVRSMEDNVALRLFPSRVAALLLGAFGGLALLLAAIGLYGVVNFSVSSRTREIGIRMSLGANRSKVIGIMMKEAMGVVAIGGVLGLAAAYVLARLVQVFLFGIQPGDPVTMILVPLLLGSVALAAGFVPARRAIRIDPTQALKTE
ncbi:MAG: ABC transporter permease [Gemmatimonadota bacterium]|jgi:predicted permease